MEEPSTSCTSTVEEVSGLRINVQLSPLVLASMVSGFVFFLRFYLFVFRERGGEGEREREKHQCVVGSLTPSTGGPGLQPRHVPCWESNQ